MQIRYTIGIQTHTRADDWIRTSIKPVYKTGAFLSRATSASTSARSRTPWGGVGSRLLSQEHTRVRPTGRMRIAHNRPRGRLNHYFSSGTFQ